LVDRVDDRVGDEMWDVVGEKEDMAGIVTRCGVAQPARRVVVAAKPVEVGL
jgi:hypothetical protein